MITFSQVRANPEIKTYIAKADQALAAIGYTEHSFPHALKVASTAKYILETLGYPEHEIELAQIAGYMHDIGNIVNRADHAQSGAMMAFRLLEDMQADPEEIAVVICAIGNHDEGTAVAVDPVSAALIIADKTDVRRSRVRNRNTISFDVHDRVNFSVKKASTQISEDRSEISLKLTIDLNKFSAMEYFEIFLDRMLLCRKAAEKLDMTFHVYINGQFLA